MGDSSRIEVFKPSRTEDLCEETSMDTPLVCSMLHTVLWITPHSCQGIEQTGWWYQSTYSSRNSEVTDQVQNPSRALSHQEVGLGTDLTTSCSAHPRGPSRREVIHNIHSRSTWVTQQCTRLKTQLPTMDVRCSSRKQDGKGAPTNWLCVLRTVTFGLSVIHFLVESQSTGQT